VLFALLAPALAAQWRIAVVGNGVERPIGDLHDLGTVELGDELQATLRLRNTASAPAAPGPVTLAGRGFTIEVAPPPSVPAGGAFDFTVRFAAQSPGGFSAGLQGPHGATLLRATAIAAATLRLEGESLQSGSIIDLGAVEAGASASRRITIQNPGAESLRSPTLAVTGPGFQLRATLPFELSPGEIRTIEVVFAPETPGPHEGALQVGGKRIVLRGSGTAIPFLRLRLIADAPARSGEQRRIVVRLDEAARSAGVGEVTMSFDGPADPAILFAGGGRSVRFNVEPGSREFTFLYQTGTTAGEIRFRAGLAAQTDETTVTIPAEPVRISSSQAARQSGALTVRVAGFDNTRSAASLIFTFLDSAGAELARQPFDARDLFAGHFRDPGAGGQFVLEARFPVSGDSSRIRAVRVEVVNLVGTAAVEAAF
jgi:hypothetical protein